ncbi:MAG TPA: glutamine--tRNA ligase/YqeY domain fusion protein [candidate division Zixibacteria bacterium]|nr:glutamine--tRNA ligase/YqeY domain fusion protein [candidate division Zixibacteria bacterium]
MNNPDTIPTNDGSPLSDGAPTSNFIRDIIDEDNKTGKHKGRVHTRFPPEPNGHLHIGHAKSICLNFGVARDYHGLCNLRFDDTNPAKEEQEFVDGIMEDIRWLGFDWEDRLYFASDYFDKLYDFAVQLIKDGKAFVCDLTADEIREHRGTLTEPGKESPYRNRSIDENLDLFERMKAGEFPDGSHTLRAKIDMASGNMNMRDPVIYRIKHTEHHRTGDKWCIYPMYDYTHCISDSLEGITHSLCSLEFDDHRPLYDWFLDQLGIFHPQQIEFARLEVTYTLMSKRRLGWLVEQGFVRGWDDPRMPTLAGLRRRGYTPRSIRVFADKVGVARKRGSVADMALMDFGLREELNLTAKRVMAVLHPLKVVITNYPEGQVEQFEAINNPEDESAGTRMIPFSREIYIERTDFLEDPPKKYFRLSPGSEVRLKHAYYITCNEVIKDDNGEVIELRCTYDPESRGGSTPDGRRIKGTLQWVSAEHAYTAEVRLYDNLFTNEMPGSAKDDDELRSWMNPDSLEVLTDCKVEPSLAEAVPGDQFQFLRHGYFSVDCGDSKPGKPIFNRTVGLRDTWAKIEKKGA